MEERTDTTLQQNQDFGTRLGKFIKYRRQKIKKNCINYSQLWANVERREGSFMFYYKFKKPVSIQFVNNIKYCNAFDR